MFHALHLLLDMFFSSALSILQFHVNFLVRSSVILAAGLLAAHWVRGRKPALASVILRIALVGVFLSPLQLNLAYYFPVPGVSVSLYRPAADTQPPQMVRSENPAVHPGLSSNSTSAAANVSPSSLQDSSGPQYPAVPSFWSVARLRAMGNSMLFFISRLMNDGYFIVISSILWLIFAGYCLMRMAAGYRKLRAIRFCSQPASEALQLRCDGAANDLFIEPVPMRVSGEIQQPCLAGILHPVVLVPVDASPDNLSREVLLHELAHCRQRDIAWLLLSRLLSSLCFYQPLLGLLNRHMEEISDEVCDDIVMQHAPDKAGYARQLVEWAEVRSTQTELWVTGLGFAEFRSNLGKRVQRILNPAQSTALRGGLWATVIALFAGIFILSASAFVPMGIPIIHGAIQEPMRMVTVTLEGNCLDAEQKPVAHADVQLLGVNGMKDDKPVMGTLAHVQSDEKGHFAFLPFERNAADLSQTSFFLRATFPGYALASSVAVLRSATHAQVDLLFCRPQTVRGQVLDPEGTPVSGVRVWVGSFLHGGQVIFTDSFQTADPVEGLSAVSHDGKFEIQDLPKDVYVNLYVEKSPYPKVIKRFKVSSEEVTLRLLRSGTIQGHVTLGDSSHPAAHVPIRAYVNNIEYGEAFDMIAETDRYGNYLLKGVCEGDCLIRTEKESWILENGVQVKVTAGETSTANPLHLVWGERIVGTVIDRPTGQPVQPGLDSSVNHYGLGEAVNVMAEIQKGGSFSIMAPVGDVNLRLNPRDPWMVVGYRSVPVSVKKGAVSHARFEVMRRDEIERKRTAWFAQQTRENQPPRVEFHISAVSDHVSDATPLDAIRYPYYKENSRRKNGMWLQRESLMDERDIFSAVLQNFSGNWSVDVTLTLQGSAKLEKITGENIEKEMAVLLDGKIVSRARIKGEIKSGVFTIFSLYTKEEAQAILSRITPWMD